MSIKLFYNGDYWNKFLDKTIFFSFDKTGFDRHSSTFNEDIYSYRLDSSVLVTGGTSGIGEEVAHQLSLLGARVMVTGRNEGKGQMFVSSHENASFSSLDMTDWKMIKSFAENSPVFDHIVLNAGSMPNKKEVNDFQVEHQCASQLLGHYFLIHFLQKYKKLNASSRIIWVSSGGMYLKKIDLDSMFINEQYEKVATYANIKRAQITLVEELVKTEEWKNSQMVSMHPGWVATDGLKEALPGFSRLVGKRLRSAKEGADTIVWLVATKSAIQPGAFYFDRSKVSAYINDSFNPTTLQRETLMNKIHSYLKEFEKREN